MGVDDDLAKLQTDLDAVVADVAQLMEDRALEQTQDAALLIGPDPTTPWSGYLWMSYPKGY